MSDQQPHCSTLCYLDASKVESPMGVLADVDLLSADGNPLGTIEGVIVEPTARCVRFYDIKSSGLRGRHYLLAADQLPQVEPNRKAVRLRDDARLTETHDLDLGALRRFSDDDLIAAMFSDRAA